MFQQVLFRFMFIHYLLFGSNDLSLFVELFLSISKTLYTLFFKTVVGFILFYYLFWTADLLPLYLCPLYTKDKSYHLSIDIFTLKP